MPAMARRAPTGSCRDPEGEIVQRILRDALTEVPLPAPWKARTNENGRSLFVNQTSGETRLEHPLTSQLKELEPVILCILVLAPEARAEAGAALSRRWQWEAEAEYKKWYAVEDSNTGLEYYCNRDTDETMWEHPHEALLPAFFLKIRCAQRLTNQDYLSSLGLYAPTASVGRQGQLQLKRIMLSIRRHILYCFTQIFVATKWLLRNFVFTFNLLCNSCRVCSCPLGGASQSHRRQQGRRCKVDAEGMAERLVDRGRISPSSMAGTPSTQAFYIGDDEDDNDDDKNDEGEDEYRDCDFASGDSAAKASHPELQDKLETAMKMAERAAWDASFKRETSKRMVRSSEGLIADHPAGEKVTPFRPGQGSSRVPRQLRSAEILAYGDGLPSEEPMVPTSPPSPSRRSRSISGAAQKMPPQSVPMAELMAYADGLPSRG
eukprot:TRINITY_DN2671_c0_g1_i1.p1 TRINITY_DN2671_c0_g1~~TRINITY_DN2671_c0_g1_i1.p1  ORF type:complete len:434 (+),score=57.11 TRINITY_DN2671_c0_g1_i1:85-1386(+)